jgi:peptidylprolyl isomerase
MRRVVKYGLFTVGSGLVIGLGVSGWMYAHRPDNSADTSQEKHVSPSGVSNDPMVLNGNGNSNSGGESGGLKVTDNGGQGFGQVLGQGTGSQTGTGGGSGVSGSDSSASSGSSGSGSGTDQLPTPSQFHVYDQYKNNATALYIDTKPGTGKAVDKGSVVTMDYRGWLTDGKEFDETYARGKQFTFTEGAGTVIDGFAQAMWGMKAGGQRRLIIPPTVGYGVAGKDPVPPDAVLVFDVELVSVQ